MLHKHTIVFLMAVLPFISFAQSDFNAYSEIGLVGAFTNYSGDIAEDEFSLGETKVGLGLYLRHTISRKIALKGQIYYGEISGDDINSDIIERRDRKFRFITPFVEVSALGEFSFFSNEHYQSGRIHATPYFFTGLGLTFADPVAEFYGVLPPGETSPFPERETQSTFFSTPIGLGAKVYFDQKISATAEFGWRPVFSDLLDGISLSANPNKQDWYLIMGLSFAYIFNQ